MTASIDNVVCFWQSFNGEVQKSYTLPSAIANPFYRYISKLLFAERDSNEFVIIFMSDGAVFCLDALTETMMLREGVSSTEANE